MKDLILRSCADMNTTVKADLATLVAATVMFNATYEPLKSLEVINSGFAVARVSCIAAEEMRL